MTKRLYASPLGIVAKYLGHYFTDKKSAHTWLNTRIGKKKACKSTCTECKRTHCKRTCSEFTVFANNLVREHYIMRRLRQANAKELMARHSTFARLIATRNSSRSRAA